MTPLMQSLFEELRASYLNRYIDPFQQEAYAIELDQLYNVLAAALPEPCRELLKRYTLVLKARDLLETEAMFQAAFAAARELA